MRNFHAHSIQRGDRWTVPEPAILGCLPRSRIINDGMHVEDGEQRGLELRQVSCDLREETRQIPVLEQSVPFKKMGEEEKRDWRDGDQSHGSVGHGAKEGVEVAEGDGWVWVGDEKGLTADVWATRTRLMVGL